MLLSSGWRLHGEPKVGSRNPLGITVGAVTPTLFKINRYKSPRVLN